MPQIQFLAQESKPLEGPFNKGDRNTGMFRYACSLQSKGISNIEIESLCEQLNQIACHPPLAENELRRTIRSALKYPKGTHQSGVNHHTPKQLLKRVEPTILDPSCCTMTADMLPDLSNLSPTQQAIKQLRAMFNIYDVVCLVLNINHRQGSQFFYAGQLLDPDNPVLRDIVEHNNVLFGYPQESGVYLVINPLYEEWPFIEICKPAFDEMWHAWSDQQRREHLKKINDSVRTRSDKNIAKFRHVLIECDELEPCEQLEKICHIFFNTKKNLVPKSIVWSGNKSYHVICSVNANTLEEYNAFKDDIYNTCIANGLPVDTHCGNPSRLSRLAGARRGESLQRLVWVDG